MTRFTRSSMIWHVIRWLAVLGLALGTVVAAALPAIPVQAQEAQVKHWGFPEGQLLRAQNSPEVYVLEGQIQALDYVLAGIRGLRL